MGIIENPWNQPIPRVLFILLVIQLGELVFQGKEAVDCSEIILTMQAGVRNIKSGVLLFDF